MKIAELRKKTGMSQRVFSDYFGIPVTTLQDWEHERRKAPAYIPSMIERILKLEGKLKDDEGID